MVQLSPDEGLEQQVLSASLKSVRKHRGMAPLEVAQAMGLPLRTYQYFEAGRGGLRLEMLRKFGLATRSDPWAVVFGVGMRDPKFAVRAIDYKVATVVLILLKTFSASVGEGLRRLDVATLLSRLRPAFDLLIADANAADEAQTWVDQYLSGLSEPPSQGDPPPDPGDESE